MSSVVQDDDKDAAPDVLDVRSNKRERAKQNQRKQFSSCETLMGLKTQRVRKRQRFI